MNRKIQILFVTLCVCWITSCSSLSTTHQTQSPEQNTVQNENVQSDSEQWDSTVCSKNTESHGNPKPQEKSTEQCSTTSTEKPTPKLNFLQRRGASILMVLEAARGTPISL